MANAFVILLLITQVVGIAIEINVGVHVADVALVVLTGKYFLEN